jgi:hypothetical protein
MKIEIGGASCTMGIGEVHRVLLWGDRMDRDHLQDLGQDGSMKLKWIFKNWDGKTWTGLLWFRIGTVGGLL